LKSDEFWSIAMLIAFIIVCFTTATVSTIRRNRARRPPPGADQVGWWSPSGPDGRHSGHRGGGHHGAGHHGAGHHGGGHHGGGGGDGGGHHGGWSGGGGDGGGSAGGHHG
jgi:hypothetical protein